MKRILAAAMLFGLAGVAHADMDVDGSGDAYRLGETVAERFIRARPVQAEELTKRDPLNPLTSDAQQSGNETPAMAGDSGQKLVPPPMPHSIQR